MFNKSNSKKYIQGLLMLSILIIGVFVGVFISDNYYKKTRIEKEKGLYLLPVLKLEVVKNDKVIYKVEKVGDMPVVNFIRLLMTHTYESRNNKEIRNDTLIDADGNSLSNIRFAYTDSTTVGSLSDMSLRIELGNDTTPPTVEDYTSKSSTYYVTAVTYYTNSYNSTHMWVLWRGTWTNNVGNDVSISEICLYIYTHTYDGSNHYYRWILIFRDVLPTPVTVPNGASLTITYILYIKYA